MLPDLPVQDSDLCFLRAALKPEVPSPSACTSSGKRGRFSLHRPLPGGVGIDFMVWISIFSLPVICPRLPFPWPVIKASPNKFIFILHFNVQPAIRIQINVPCGGFHSHTSKIHYMVSYSKCDIIKPSLCRQTQPPAEWQIHMNSLPRLDPRFGNSLNSLIRWLFWHYSCPGAPIFRIRY